MANFSKPRRPVRYAVIGQGHIAQVAVLPAFRQAKKNSVLSAIISDDPVKLRALGRKYDVERLCTYDQFDECLSHGDIDALYIALPNHLHCEYTVRAARLGVHVLCEKPLGITEAECEEMIRECRQAGVRLMTAYRLHFEEANLKAIQLANSGRLGDLRAFNSVFSMQVEEGNIRLKRSTGGGTLYDIGIYCINAARNLFRAEPLEVLAVEANNGERRFREVDEMTTAILRFPKERLATFTTSFGAGDVDHYRLVGTKGDLVVEPAYTYHDELTHRITIGEKTKERKFRQRDQFAPELIYFSDCIRSGRAPEPSGLEGLADVRVIEALLRSASEGRPARLAPFEKRPRPDLSQQIYRPAGRKPRTVRAPSPHPEE